MPFKDRQHAGKLLAQALEKYKDNPNAIVLGLPRGGVVVAYEVAHQLHLPLDIICARKIGAPYNPEFAIGAITETGDKFIDEETLDRLDISNDYLSSEIQTQTTEAKRRLDLYRQGRPCLDLEHKIAILVDDGVATGATMKAAIQTVKSKKALTIVVATPIASSSTLTEIEAQVHEVVCIAAPSSFMAVGQFYENFSQTTDQEVIELISRETT